MADNIVGGLFGVDPQQLMQQRQATDAANAFRYAQLDPLQQAKMSIYQGGAGLTRAVGGLLGGDPELEKVSKIKQLSSQFDLTTSKGMREFAQQLQQFAPNEAMMAAKRADEMDVSIATVKQKSRESVPKVDEIVNQQLWNKSLQEADGDTQKAAQIYREQEIKNKERTSPKTTIDLGGVFDKFFTKKEAEDQAETWNKAGQAYADASKLGRSVREMESVVGNAFVGSYGSLKAGVSRALGGGKKLEDTEVLDALSAQLVLPLAKLLPGSLAVKELDQLIKTKPNLSQQEATIRRLLATISQDLRASEITYEAGEKYRAANNGSIKGFNPYITNNKATRLTELQGIFAKNGKLTDAQKKEAQALTKELQVEAM